MARARSELLSQLCACLRRALERAEETGAGDAAASPLADLLGAFADADAEDDAAKWVRTEWVAPRLTPLLSAAATAFVSPHARTRAPTTTRRAVPAQDWTAGCETFT